MSHSDSGADGLDLSPIYGYLRGKDADTPRLERLARRVSEDADYRAGDRAQAFMVLALLWARSNELGPAIIAMGGAVQQARLAFNAAPTHLAELWVWARCLQAEITRLIGDDKLAGDLTLRLSRELNQHPPHFRARILLVMGRHELAAGEMARAATTLQAALHDVGASLDDPSLLRMILVHYIWVQWHLGEIDLALAALVALQRRRDAINRLPMLPSLPVFSEELRSVATALPLQQPPAGFLEQLLRTI